MKPTQHFASVRQWRASVSLAFTASFLVAAAFASSTSMAAGLNDTGFTTCADAAGALVSCTAASAVPGQDARYGRDAAAGTSALTKVGGGANGFDFTKISNAGAVLPATAPLGTAPGEWGCTYDNTTGLMWEVKTATSGLRNQSHSYSWYNTNATTNGGSVGVANNLIGSGANANVKISLKPSVHLEVVGAAQTELKVGEMREGSVVFRVRAKDNLGSDHGPTRQLAGGSGPECGR